MPRAPATDGKSAEHPTAAMPDGPDLGVNAVISDYGELDLDFDGHSAGLEWMLGTDPADGCPDNQYDAAWPPDFTNNRAVDILDVVKFIPKLGYSEGQPGYDRRYDLKPNFSIDILDVVVMIPLLQSFARCTN